MKRPSVNAGLLRDINRSAILELIRTESPISKSEIARRLKISLPTVMRIIEELMQEDFVIFDGQSESTGGRPPSLLRFNGDAYSVVGVDLGGNKIFGTVADLSGKVQYEQVNSLDVTNTQSDNINELCLFIEQLLNAPRPPGQKIRGIGIGAPGITLTPDGVVTWGPALGWRNLPLKKILNEHFSIPVFVENEANLNALGEWGFGIGQGTRNMICIVIGTGIGAGIIIDNALFRGHNQAAGEIGYMIPSVNYLNNTYETFGVLESLASRNGIVERAQHLLDQENLSFPTKKLSAEDIFIEAQNGTAWAQQIVNETVDLLSLAIVNSCALFDPELVILSGGITQFTDLLIEPIQKRISGVIPYLPRLEVSKLGRRAASMGAIKLVLDSTTEHYVIKRLP